MQLSIHKAQTSILVFGIIMIGQGLFLVIAPNVLLQLLGIEDAKDYWVRFVWCGTFSFIDILHFVLVLKIS